MENQTRESEKRHTAHRQQSARHQPCPSRAPAASTTIARGGRSDPRSAGAIARRCQWVTFRGSLHALWWRRHTHPTCCQSASSGGHSESKHSVGQWRMCGHVRRARLRGRCDSQNKDMRYRGSCCRYDSCTSTMPWRLSLSAYDTITGVEASRTSCVGPRICATPPPHADTPIIQPFLVTNGCGKEFGTEFV